MTLVIGVGASSRSDAREIGALIAAVLDRDDLRGEDVACVATAAARAGTGHVRDAAEMLGFHLVTYPVDVLAEVAVPNPEEGVRARTGTASVAEAAALHGARALGGALPAPGGGPSAPGGGARLVVPKRTAARATAAVARITGEPGEAGS
ncbi:cobalamin biosynthesis protein [Actinomadura violacea]|uniref:Cobalamin biosynthesis protein n=1 Tax=Actinomadura violacea TaxID=2819934 RepID=A0ABS3S3J7_9ACTN|nr:cobalamin biosynthesis protein [Actinomadura violacea]MBO2463308.1 cobalamin biosynthesis protein [Actinomadura violacea]